MVDDLVVTLGYRYRSDTVSVEGDGEEKWDSLDLSGKPGTRAPHVWLEQQGRRISTLDLSDIHFVLLAGAAGNAWCNAAREAAAALAIPLDVYRVSSDGDLHDQDGDWHSAYSVTTSGAVLLRPDGFVAWRAISLEGDAGETMERVLRQVLSRVPVA
jgi:tetracenomycin A2 monooxygenase-dioxygenase